jgi:hypothetical protein
MISDLFKPLKSFADSRPPLSVTVLFPGTVGVVLNLLLFHLMRYDLCAYEQKLSAYGIIVLSTVHLWGHGRSIVGLRALLMTCEHIWRMT